MILVAIGANLPGPRRMTPRETCRAAAEALGELPGLRLVAISRWYETVPVPRSDQPNYINGVARLERLPEAVIAPETMLAFLQAIEDRFGRQRSEPNAARTLDLDLIDMEGLIRHAPDPILPHPRAHSRAFVLRPLLDVAPDWVHPEKTRSGGDLLAAADQSGTRVLEP